MSSRNNQKWGAGLMALSRGLGDWQAENERKRRQAELRQQQLDDLAGLRIYNEGLLNDKYAREDEENLRKYGPVIPPPDPSRIDFSAPGIGMASTGAAIPANNDYDYLGVQLDRRQHEGRYASQALADHIALNPKFRPAADSLDTTRVVRVGTPEGGYTSIEAKASDPFGAVSKLETVDSVPEYAGEVDGVPTFNMVPTIKRAPADDNWLGAQREDALRETYIKNLTREAVGPTESRLTPERIVTKKGSRLTGGQIMQDVAYGGKEVSPNDMMFVGSELPRQLASIARDSMMINPARWNLDVPPSQLAAAAMKDLDPSAALALPAGFDFDDKGDLDPTNDVFIERRKGKVDNKFKPIEFFSKQFVPMVNQADNPEIAWKSLVKTAGQYGIDPDKLIQYLNPEKFKWLLGAAQTEVQAREAGAASPTQKTGGAPVPGAIKLSDGNWYTKGADGKVTMVPRSGA